MTLCICGIDPGLEGAIAFYFPDVPTRVSVYDMPIVAGEVDGAGLAAKLRQLNPDHVFLERVHVMPGRRSGVGTLLQGFGCIKGVVAALGIPITVVMTTKWKPALGLSVGQGKSEKDKHEASRLMALRRFPAVPEHFARKKDHNRAEAALIAVYGADRSLIPARQTEAA